MTAPTRPFLTVGVTGRSGSGKSTVSAHYAHLGYPVADGDALSREVTAPGSPCLARLAEAFGPSVLLADGSLNRKALGDIAFSQPALNQRLMEITHPAITELLQERIAGARAGGHRLFFVDGAMIIGSPVQPLCNKLVVVAAPPGLAVKRLLIRDGITEEAAQKRLRAQPSQQSMQQAADYVIQNDGGPEKLLEQADAVLEQLLRLIGPQDPRI